MSQRDGRCGFSVENLLTVFGNRDRKRDGNFKVGSKVKAVKRGESFEKKGDEIAESLQNGSAVGNW